MTESEKRKLGSRARGFETRFALSLVLVFYSMTAARADVRVSLPLEGHYRPGKYMPVHVAIGGADGPITLRAAGAVPTQMQAPAGQDAILPWLPVTGSIRDVHCESGGSGGASIDLPIRALAGNEKLVGVAGEDADAARPLFPGKTIVPIALNLSQPLPGPPCAWETLDALVLSEAAFARLSEDQWQTLAAAGTALIVHSSQAPNRSWPWRKVGNDWVLSYLPAGPDSLTEDEVYMPTYGWERGWPPSFRRRAILLAVLFSIFVTALALWRSRWAVVALLGFCAMTAGGLAWWYSRVSPMLELVRGVMVLDDSVAQYDSWMWRSPVHETDDTMPSVGLTHPYFASAQQIEQTGIRLIYRASDGRMQFAYHLDRGQSLAFLTRWLIARPQLPALQPDAGAMRDFAEQFYLGPSARILGQYVADSRDGAGQVPVIVVGR